jgi:hypothetical protein
MDVPGKQNSWDPSPARANPRITLWLTAKPIPTVKTFTLEALIALHMSLLLQTSPSYSSFNRI